MVFDFPLSYGSSSWERLLCSNLWRPDYVIFFSGLLLVPLLLLMLRKLNGLSCTWVCVCTRVVRVVNTSLRGGPAPSRTARAYCLSHVSAACVCVLLRFSSTHNTLLHVLNYSLSSPLPLLFLLIFSVEWRYLL